MISPRFTSPVIDAINEAFKEMYPGSLSEPVYDDATLVKRVKMIVDDLACTRINWHTAEKSYNKLDREKRGMRWHWWQFWLPKGQRWLDGR